MLPYDVLEVLVALAQRAARLDDLKAIALALTRNAEAYGADAPLRMAHFLGQAAHETGGFIWFEELGTNKYFERYEGRADLGNTEPGDGVKFHGRGIFQLTGRENYRVYGEELDLGLIADPDLASDPYNATLIALAYWKKRKIAKWADQDDLQGVTRRINGGLIGLTDRAIKTSKAKRLLGLENL